MIGQPFVSVLGLLVSSCYSICTRCLPWRTIVSNAASDTLSRTWCAWIRAWVTASDLAITSAIGIDGCGQSEDNGDKCKLHVVVEFGSGNLEWKDSYAE